MDEKKQNNSGAELNDEQLDQAAGGLGVESYKCHGGCGGSYVGRVPYYVQGQPWCANCYAAKQMKEKAAGDRMR